MAAWGILLGAASLAAATRSGTATIHCTPTSRSLAVSWSPDDGAAIDLWYIAIYGTQVEATNASSPFAVVPSTTTKAAIVDGLAPSTTYYLRVRAHPASAPSIVAGWSNYSSGPAVACRTRVPPSLLLDQLGPAADSSIRLAWRWTCGARASSLPITVQWQPLSAELGAEPMSVVLPAGTVSHVLTGLPASTKFAVTVAAAAADGSMGSHHGSGTVTCSTAAAGAIYEIVYRVSELTDGVDFLPNHNAGDLIGEAAFLSDSGNFALPPSELATDACATALNKTHCTPGSSSCMDCAAAVWATGTGPAANAVRAQCSDPGREFPLDNKVAESWCGSAFSFFDWTATPLSEFCVERLPAPATAAPPAEHGGVEGYTRYLSCNAPEAAVVHNDKRDPVCICECYADRMIAFQNRSVVEQHCGVQPDPEHPIYPQCNCTAGSVLLAPGDPALRFPGATRVHCPYYFYNTPQDAYPLNTLCGLWYSFPKDGRCPDGGPGVSQACSWQRQGVVRVVYGAALLDAGWDRSSSFDDKTGLRVNTTQQTLHNAQVIAKAFSALDTKLRRLCCGC